MDEWLAGWLQHVYGHWSSDLLNSTVAKGPHTDFENMSCAVAWVAPCAWPGGPVARWPGGPGGPVAPVAAGPCSSPRARRPWSCGRARGPVLVARDRDFAFARQSHFARLLTWFEWFPTTIQMLEFVTRPQKYRGLAGRMRSPSAHTVFTVVT